MQRHHGALTEADERERRRRQLLAGKLGVKETLQYRRGLVGANPALVRIAERQREPLPPDWRLTAGLRRMRRDERRLRQQLLPGAADLDQIVAVGAITMKKHDQLSRGPRAR